MRRKVRTVISTFAGCGGSSLGYKMAGFDVRLAVEFDKDAITTYRRNFPKTPIWETDIADLSPEKAMEMAHVKPGELDVLDGSPPCQGFSTAGKRRINDARNSLFKEYARLLQTIQPRAMVMENVSGLVKGKMRLVFRDILLELGQCGYDVKARILNTKWHGVPQSRARVIFIGIRNDLNTKPEHPHPTTKPMTCGEALEGIDAKGPRLSEKVMSLMKATKPGKSACHTLQKRGGWTKARYFNMMRLDQRRPSPTILKMWALGASGIVHWDGEHMLSADAVKRLGSFPDDFDLGDWKETVKRVGNSVPPLFMKAIAGKVKETLDMVNSQKG